MAWVYLALAGFFEVVMAISLKAAEGFTKLIPATLFIVSMIASLGLLGLALRTLPLGTGYAVWTGIGILGTTIFGIVALNESTQVSRVLCIVLIAVGIIGLKFLTPQQ
jgi:quaternary ammonium compound-resistance protein SugE